MDYYTLLINQSELCRRPLLTAIQADEEIARLQGVIKAMAGTIMELQEALFSLKGKKDANPKSD